MWLKQAGGSDSHHKLIPDCVADQRPEILIPVVGEMPPAGDRADGLGRYAGHRSGQCDRSAVRPAMNKCRTSERSIRFGIIELLEDVRVVSLRFFQQLVEVLEIDVGSMRPILNIPTQDLL